MGLRSWMLKHPVHPGLQLMQKPYSVKTTTAIPVKALMLVPATNRIDRKASQNSIALGELQLITGNAASVQPFHLGSTIIPPIDQKGTSNGERAWVVPFWFVSTVKEESEANIVAIWEQTTYDDIEFQLPCFTNPKRIEAGTILTRYAKVEPPTAKGQKRQKRN